MKRLLSTVLLACFVLGAWAQNKTKMTEEEKKEAMKQLEVLYQFETGTAFGELDSLTESQEFKQDRLPWEKWADKFKHKSFKKSLSRLFMCFDKAFIEPNKDSPIFFNLMLRGKDEDVSSYFGGRKEPACGKSIITRMRTGTSRGSAKNFSSTWRLICSFIWRINRANRSIPDEDIYLLEGGDYAQNKDMLNIWFGLQIPLTVPYQEIAGGHISLSFYMPEKYDRIIVPIKDFGDKPVQVTWGNKTFSIEKVDSNGFIISADAETLDKLKGMKRLYHRDGNWYEPSSSTSTTGDLDKILKNSTRKITFEEWLKEEGIDLNNLEETLKHFMEDEASEENDDTDAAGMMGKHYRTALQGDSLLLYMPDEKRREIAEITVFAPSEGEASRLIINRERCNELIEWLCTEKSPDNTKQTEPEEMEEVDYFSPDFQPAKPINPQTGMPDEWNIILAQLLRKPEEAVEQGITGRMTAEITIGTDGVASNVKINGDPHPLLEKAVCDCLYGIKYVPAKWKGKAISFVTTLPVIFK
ncbi:energy transducer TonB [Phocaeicola vulgatus]|uniref:energy transducer TonB n=1 Tax=Phocaeicola vulgatus TaxID=821 RepID=UPI0032BF38F2